jgi:hypothetical protein
MVAPGKCMCDALADDVLIVSRQKDTVKLGSALFFHVLPGIPCSAASDSIRQKLSRIHCGSTSRCPAATAHPANSRRRFPSSRNRRRQATNSSRVTQGTAPFGAIFEMSKLSLSKLQAQIWQKSQDKQDEFTLSDIDLDDDIMKSLIEKDTSDKNYKINK